MVTLDGFIYSIAQRYLRNDDNGFDANFNQKSLPAFYLITQKVFQSNLSEECVIAKICRITH